MENFAGRVNSWNNRRWFALITIAGMVAMSLGFLPNFFNTTFSNGFGVKHLFALAGVAVFWMIYHNMSGVRT